MNEIKAILKNWDETKNGNFNIEPIKENIWVVNKSYILKAFKEIKKVSLEIEMSKALEMQGLKARTPISTVKGMDFYEGKSIFILFNKVEGNIISAEEYYSREGIEYAYQAGRGIGKLHVALKEIEGKVKCDEANLYDQIVNFALPQIIKQNIQWSMGIADEFFKDYINNLSNIIDKLPKQIIHRDINTGNIIYSNQKVTGYIDFELCEKNIRIFDICYLATGILSERMDKPEKQEKWFRILKSIIKGYESIINLTDVEKGSIFYVICSIQMVCIAFFAEHNEYEELASINRNIFKFIIENRYSIEYLKN